MTVRKGMYPLWRGLNCTWERLMLYCEHDPECRALLLEQVEQMPSADQTENPRNPSGRKGKESIDNINRLAGGTDPSYILARLKRDPPDLARQVIDGAISAHAAAIEAGIRKRMKSVPIDTPSEALRALLRVFSASELGEAFRALQTERVGLVK